MTGTNLPQGPQGAPAASSSPLVEPGTVETEDTASTHPHRGRVSGLSPTNPSNLQGPRDEPWNGEGPEEGEGPQDGEGGPEEGEGSPARRGGPEEGKGSRGTQVPYMLTTPPSG